MKQKIKYWAVLAVSILFLSGCSQSEGGREQEPGADSKENTGFVMTGPGSYDSADTAVITKIDTAQSTITFYNNTVSRKYTLNYDGATFFYDKYGQAVSLEQVKEGNIVDITFLKSKKRLDTLKASADAWENASVSRYEINLSRHDVTIGTDIYKLTSDTLMFSGGQQIEMMDLNSSDVLTFSGIGTSVYSIVVEKGHGYLRLVNDENFIDGWIEVGQSLIRQITEDMLLTVPEGSYEVLLSHKGNSGVKNVIINRDEEVTLDIGDIEIAETQYGQVVFAMTPSAAAVYINGDKVDTGSPVTLEYGIYQLIAMADGYSTMTTYLRVAQPSAGVELTLEKEGSEEETGQKDNSASSGNAGVATNYYRVYIDSPEGAEVYVDGNYVGVAPVSFKKTEGAHVITLRKTGYETRSYTIQVDDEDKDVSYSFADLTAVTGR